MDAMQRDPSKDDRCPVIVVIDEAHNLAPAEPASESVVPVIDALVRIAMEGRKYGLFLLLVTQRPGRLNASLISQCDNLCLMKMSNHADLGLVEKSFGFLPAGLASRALDFEVGQVLLAGKFIDRQQTARAAPRRTVEGGRSLRDDYWLQDPVPEPPATAG
jgi:DNA helicase HerA-like ATPase